MKVTVIFCEETRPIFELGLVNIFDIYEGEIVGPGWCEIVGPGWCEIIDDNGNKLLLWENEWKEWTDES